MPSSATHSWVQEAQPKGPFFSPKAHRSHDLPLSLEKSTLSSLAPPAWVSGGSRFELREKREERGEVRGWREYGAGWGMEDV